MKVRQKHLASPYYQVIEESSSFYIVENLTGGHSSLEKADYEPVPTERWVDVTDECEVPVYTGKEFEVWRGGDRILQNGLPGYRIVKTHGGFRIQRKETT